MKHLFIQQLEDIREVMLSKANHVLQMGVWFDDGVGLTEYNTLDCGYAACVCGEVVLSGRLDSFSEALERKEVAGFSRLAYFVSEDLDNACADLTYGIHNAASLYASESELRKVHAETAHLFTQEELDNLAHLNKEHPTAQDVADYLEVLIVKLVDKYGWGV